MFCSLPKRRLRCTNLPNPTARIGFFIGSLAKRRLRCTDLPNPTARIGFFYAHLWPSDGCDAPIFRIQPSGLVSTPLFRSLGKPRLRCTDLPNPTVRIGFHQHLWILDQATAPMHQSPQTQRPRIGYFYYTHCVFWSLPKWRLRCTNSSKTNRQDVRTCDNDSAYLHIAPFVLETENSFSPPEFKFCSLSSNYFYLFTGQILIKNLFTHNLPGGRVFSPRELGTHILPGGRVFVLRELGTHILPKGRVFLLRSIQPRLLYAKFIFSPFSFRHLHLQGDGYLFWGG
jgi:hypothetical protein